MSPIQAFISRMSAFLDFKLFKHFAIFGGSKFLVFIVPLFGATVLEPVNYGTFEFAIAIAFPLTILLGLSAPNYIALSIINRENQVKRLFSPYLFVVAISLISLSVSLIAFYILDNFTLSLIAIIVSFLTAQQSISSYIKAKGYGAWSNVMDAFIYLSLGVVFLSDKLGIITFRLMPLFLALLVFFQCLFILQFFIFKIKSPKKLFVYFKLFLIKSSQVSICGCLMVTSIALPRIYLGVIGDLNLVAEFSFWFRLAAVGMITHQFIVILKFRQLLKSSDEKFFKVGKFLFILVFFISALFLFSISYIESIRLFFELPNYLETMPLLFIITPLCIATWSTSALLETKLYVKGKYLNSFIILIISGACIFILLNLLSNQKSSVLSLSYNWLISLVFIIIGQVVLLRKRSIHV